MASSDGAGDNAIALPDRADAPSDGGLMPFWLQERNAVSKGLNKSPIWLQQRNENVELLGLLVLQTHTKAIGILQRILTV